MNRHCQTPDNAIEFRHKQLNATTPVKWTGLARVFK